MDRELVHRHKARVAEVEAAVGNAGFVVGGGVQLDLQDRYVLVEIDDTDDCAAIGYPTLRKCVENRDEECGVVGIYDLRVHRWFHGTVRFDNVLCVVGSPINCSFGGGA